MANILRKRILKSESCQDQYFLQESIRKKKINTKFEGKDKRKKKLYIVDNFMKTFAKYYYLSLDLNEFRRLKRPLKKSSISFNVLTSKRVILYIQCAILWEVCYVRKNNLRNTGKNFITRNYI